ncbi:MAG: metalloregulator ArsR/SmtB family transcription factor [Phycisphaerae bacterium]
MRSNQKGPGRTGANGRRQTSFGTAPNRLSPRPEAWDLVARTLKAVAHPTRLRILNLLETGERSVGEITEALGTKNATTSRQLGLMRDRGVLSARRTGNRVYYRIANPNLVEVVRCVRRSGRIKKGKDA